MIQAIKINNAATEKAELSILKTLAYFDIFDYPLSEEEIRNFLGEYVREGEFKSAIRNLLFKKIIFEFGEFYSLHDDHEAVEKRLLGNLRAKKLLPKAARIGAFLYRFPYVRAIAVSGSLSKNYADKKTDIDFFIIVKQDRLWIARTILHLFKKFTFLLGRQHFYCMNYFIDEKALAIKEQNIYTATEVVTLLPIAGNNTLKVFFEINEWTEEWLPAYARTQNSEVYNRGSVFKKSLEVLFNKKMGDKLENLLFKWTTWRWQKKEKLGRKNLKGKIMNLVTDRHFSKSDPGAFQEKIIALYETKISQLKSRWTQYFY